MVGPGARKRGKNQKNTGLGSGRRHFPGATYYSLRAGGCFEGRGAGLAHTHRQNLPALLQAPILKHPSSVCIPFLVDILI